MVSHISIS
jgi:hypothetical protein